MATELDDAGVEDIRPITGHDQANTNKINERKATAIARKRREHLTLLADPEADDSEGSSADLPERDTSNVGMKGGYGG
ncbi:hypothetical protein V5F89_11890 [Pelagerythrobacter marensis]|uniref:Uncharacterized protein n=1 Tax=Pelagerythrobacter marensis TaxID=543877 RepID=A0ABZ2D9B3_9SPHN